MRHAHAPVHMLTGAVLQARKGSSVCDKLSGVMVQVLRDIRGVDNVEEDFQDIKAACERAALVVNPWRTIFKPSYAPQLFVAITATLFQQASRSP